MLLLYKHIVINMSTDLSSFVSSLIPLCFGGNWKANNSCGCGWFISEDRIQYREQINGGSWCFFDKQESFMLHNIFTSVGYSLSFNGVEENNREGGQYGLYQLTK